VSRDEILALSCTQLAAAIRERRTSALAAMEAVLGRAREVQPKLNCFLRIDDARALEAARQADRQPARGPLHGVPMAHKDMYYREGVASSCGSKILRERPAPATATALERLDTAGAIQFGVLNMTEFALGPTGHNWHYGHCRNPWNPERITGGSSSGTGASVAARANFAGLGSDTGGSIRLPAALCATSAIKAPSVITICTPRRSAAVRIASANVRQRMFGSTPLSKTRSRSAVGTLTVSSWFSGQSIWRVCPSTRRIVGRLTWKS